jgi:site-specific DNA recombinase
VIARVSGFSAPHFRESGVCKNGRKVYIAAIEKAVLTGLREHLTQRDTIDAYVNEYNAERRRLAKANNSRRTQLERRAGEVKRDLDRAVQMLIKGLCDEEAMREPIKALQNERDSIAQSLTTMTQEGKVIALHPAAVSRYLTDVERLNEVMAENADGQSDELIAIVRRLISTVTVRAKPGGGPVTIELKGRLRELMAPASGLFPDCLGGERPET